MLKIIDLISFKNKALSIIKSSYFVEDLKFSADSIGKNKPKKQLKYCLN